MELQKLIEFVGREVVFDETGYPDLKEASGDARLRFILKHSALHFTKTAGKIAAVSERADHGEAPDINGLKEEMAKSLINLLWLAEKTGMTEEEFVSVIENKYGKQISV